MEDLDLALSGLEKIHKVVNDVSPFFCNIDVDNFEISVIDSSREKK